MIPDCRKLTIYFGERDRAGGRFLADALIDRFARHQLATSLMLRGAIGFGPAAHLRTDRRLTLSEDLPMTAVAVDTGSRIEAVFDEVAAVASGGLVTLERAALITDRRSAAAAAASLPAPEAKLTVYVGRGERLGAVAAYEWIVARLREHAVAGATVLLGVDGTVRGERRRASFVRTNRGVPLMVIAVGRAAAVGAALTEIAEALPAPLMTVEGITVCRRDGAALAAPAHRPPAVERPDLAGWQKLMVYAGEQARADGGPLHEQLVRELRGAGAAGATGLRGLWGYHGDHLPHGDSFWQLRRRVPVVTVIVDSPERIGSLYPIIERLTAGTGLVTSEPVAALSRPPTPAAVHRRARHHGASPR